MEKENGNGIGFNLHSDEQGLNNPDYPDQRNKKA
jgi:hypothetical protein